MNEALVIVDIQNDYFKGSKFELVNADVTLEVTKKTYSFL